MIKRGFYKFDKIYFVIGDFFGFLIDDRCYYVNFNIIIYLVFLDLKKYFFFCLSFLGEVVVKRYYYEDIFYFVGIREY